MKCDKCGKEIVPKHEFSTGYGIYRLDDGTEQKLCYECCGEMDTEYMRTHDKMTLYLSPLKDGKEHRDNMGYHVTNWPGSIDIHCNKPWKGNHFVPNVGYIPRYDVWFKYVGKRWHGVQYGDMTQLVHCKVVKPF